MRRILAAVSIAMGWLFVVAAPSAAHAAMMAHYDLAGLVLESDAVVVAIRTPPAPCAGPCAGHDPASRYRVTRVLRGPLAVGDELALDDGLYNTTGHAIDAEVVAFLRRVDRGWYLTSSGLRVTDGGKVFRFEQWDNPGGFTMVPQGHDPADQWRGGAAIDRATFDRELTAAIARADAVAPALALTDPARRRAAALALLAPPGAGRPGLGFYRDEVAARIAAGLAAAGDLDGALDARGRDRSGIAWRGELARAPTLLAIAADPAAAVERRALALGELRAGALFADAPGVRAVVALLADPAPAVRAAAVPAAAAVLGWSGGDAAAERINRGLRREVRRALAARFAVESDAATLVALAKALDGRRLPSRRGGLAVAAAVEVIGGALRVDVRCLRPARLARPTLTDGGAAVGGWVSMTCGATRTGGGDGSATRWTAGAHPLTLTLQVDRRAVTVPLGTLTADAAGEVAIAPP